MKRLLFSIVLLCIITNLGCQSMAMASSQDVSMSKDDKVAEQFLIPLLHALRNRDKESMYELWVDKVESKENNNVFESLFDLWNGREFSSVEKLSEKKRIAEGDIPGGIVYRYSVVGGDEISEVEFTIMDNSKDIDWIYLIVDPQVTGTHTTWKQFNIAQWLMTIVALAEITLSFYTAWLCIKKKPRYWGLWLAFILTIYGGFAFTTKGDFIISLYIHTFALPKIISVKNQIIQVYLSVPIGAIIYWIKYGKNRRSGTNEETKQHI